LTIQYGALGMACATALSEFSKNLIVYGLLRREFEIRYPWGSSIRFFLAAIVVAGLLLLLKEHINFIVAGGLGGVAWIVALRAFRVLSKDQRELIHGHHPAPLSEDPSGRPGSLVGPISFWPNGAQPEHPDFEVSRPVCVSTKPEYLWPVGKPTRQR
jgi:hypothetical protein